jgi:carbon monoxide dehydrogenase subunit G
MEMTGSQLIPIPQEVVWAGLNDAKILKACVPGCESLQRVSDTEYRAVIVVAIGPTKSKFTGKLLLLDIDAPHSYRTSFEGSGGAAGTANGGARVSLAPEGAGTRLTYVARVQVGGKLVQVGSRLIDGVAKKMTDEFFRRFSTCTAELQIVHPSEPVVHSTSSSSSSYVKWAIAAAVMAGVVVLWFALR